jgi:hypothetical protein
VGSPLAGCPFPLIAKIIISKIKEVFPMKPKKINKKLSFSKSTIADLNFKELDGVHGGDPVTTKPVGSSYVECEPTCDDRTCFHIGSICVP